MNLIGVMIPASGPWTPVWTPRGRWCCADWAAWLVNDLADDVLSEQDRISLAITVRTMKEETEKWQSAS
jgi:hypothetical protein